jgi:hypothetical protein
VVQGFTVAGGFAAVYSKVSGMGAPMSSKAWRCSGVAVMIFSISRPPLARLMQPTPSAPISTFRPSVRVSKADQASESTDVVNK